MKKLLPALFLFSFIQHACHYHHHGHTPVPSTESCTAITTWKPLVSGSSATLIHIDFTNSLHGYAGGYNGALVKTIDGGKSFYTLSLGNTEDVNAIDFVSSEEGYVASNVRELTSSVSHLYKTTNGGIAFTTLNTGVNMYYRSIRFVNQQLGFAAGGEFPYSSDINGRLIKTTDAGAHWTNISVSGLKCVYDMHFTDAATGYLCGSYGQIFKTTDGGDHWSDISPELNQTTSLSNVLLSDINFISPSTGYCIGASRSYDENFILKTTNGGNTWTRIYGPASGYSTVDFYGSIIFTTNSIGYISGGNINNNTGTILVTTDGGNNWTTQHTSTPWLSRMSLIDCHTIYVAGNNGTVLKSN